MADFSALTRVWGLLVSQLVGCPLSAHNFAPNSKPPHNCLITACIPPPTPQLLATACQLQENVKRVQLADEYMSGASLAGETGSSLPEKYLGQVRVLGLF